MCVCPPGHRSHPAPVLSLPSALRAKVWPARGACPVAFRPLSSKRLPRGERVHLRRLEAADQTAYLHVYEHAAAGIVRPDDRIWITIIFYG